MSLSVLTNIEFLDVSNNKIEDENDFQVFSMKKLKKLCIFGNKIAKNKNIMKILKFVLPNKIQKVYLENEDNDVSREIQETHLEQIEFKKKIYISGEDAFWVDAEEDS